MSRTRSNHESIPWRNRVEILNEKGRIMSRTGLNHGSNQNSNQGSNHISNHGSNHGSDRVES